MMKFNNTFLALALCCLAAQAQAQTWGNLKVRFVLDGAMPAAEEVKVPANAAFCGDFKQVDESLVVNKENNGIANVYVYAYTSGRDSVELPSIHPDLKDAESKTYELANKNCRFEPHALLLRTGDKLKVTNPDKVGHNAHIFFFENPESNLLIPPGKEQVLAVDLPERAPTNVTCDIHPWMTGKVHVIDHPYGAISDKDGKVSIANIPAGTKLAFRVVHEKARKLSGTKVGDSELSRRNVFEVTLTEGDNDLGEVKVPVSAFEG